MCQMESRRSSRLGKVTIIANDRLTVNHNSSEMTYVEAIADLSAYGYRNPIAKREVFVDDFYKRINQIPQMSFIMTVFSEPEIEGVTESGMSEIGFEK